MRPLLSPPSGGQKGGKEEKLELLLFINMFGGSGQKMQSCQLTFWPLTCGKQCLSINCAVMEGRLERADIVQDELPRVSLLLEQVFRQV